MGIMRVIMPPTINQIEVMPGRVRRRLFGGYSGRFTIVHNNEEIGTVTARAKRENLLYGVENLLQRLFLNYSSASGLFNRTIGEGSVDIHEAHNVIIGVEHFENSLQGIARALNQRGVRVKGYTSIIEKLRTQSSPSLPTRTPRGR